jgi:hypothetical protein
MRIPREKHTARPRRIHEIAPDFVLEDVWALPTPGGPDDFTALVEAMTGGRLEDGASPVGRFIWAVRWKLGRWFGWDREDGGLGNRVSSLRERLPDDLRDRPTAPSMDNSPFTPVYMTDDEYAAEIANTTTMHGILHLGWVRTGDPAGTTPSWQSS